ncbi:biotin--[acetyl-CoA-carboxylase] ligase [Nesterenkonia populi]|uniref:biotin--[acetyl-CoA-carboxylase] ligase n=1 Tax=Nesterenkonia populi TaxID=1591087 RepID=UPI0011BED064|nr:biotin--[acetyl-CoA-carboxylase] ligase [Nesterenkonia populi]
METQARTLDEARLRRELVDAGVCGRLVRTESTASTTADLAKAAQQSGFAEVWPDFSALTAEKQTAGTGRTGRSWSSPRCTSLSTSLVLRPALPPEQRHWLSLVSGLALVQALREEHDVDASLKWPNDVLIGVGEDASGRKIAGSAAMIPPGDPQAVILGCGINVLQTAEELPTPTSTSLLLETSEPLGEDPRTDLLISWLRRFRALYLMAHGEGDIAPVRPLVVEQVSTIGQQVRVHLPGEEQVTGSAVAVEEDGGLTVETPHGSRTFRAGDVVHLRRDP